MMGALPIFAHKVLIYVSGPHADREPPGFSTGRA